MFRRLLLLALCASELRATTYNSDGSVSNINSLISSATAGDTITVPASSFTWSSAVTINKNVTLQSLGTSTITLNTAISLTGGGRITGFTFNYAPGITAISAITVSNWRIDHNTFNAGDQNSDTVVADCPGLIDHCTFVGVGGANIGPETIWTTALGGTGAHATQDAVWETDPTFGSASAIYVEDCTFSNGGYVSDFGYASRAVVRMTTITGMTQIDAHGPESNWRSNRQVEIYNNTWNVAGTVSYNAMNIRGGAAMIFNNTASGNSGHDYFLVHHYGPETNGYGENYAPLLQHQFWTPYEYPLPDQEAVGKNPGKVGGADPLYVFNNTRNGSPWVEGNDFVWTNGFDNITGTTNSAGYSTGATSITLTALTGGTGVLYAGNIIQFAGDTHYYTVAADRLGAGVLTIQSPGLQTAIPASATGLSCNAKLKYKYQSGDNTDYTDFQFMKLIIKPDRDIFFQNASFNGSSGVGTGTYAQMQAITPTTLNVGFWVTDRGNWNRTLAPNTSGQLWVWNGSAWTFKYEPYTYPHPLTGGLPAQSSVAGVVTLKGTVTIK